MATALLWAPGLAVALPVDGPVDYLPDVPRWYLLAWRVLFAVAWFFFGRAVRSRRLVTTALESGPAPPRPTSRPWPTRPSPRSAAASPGNCTTWSPTTWR